MTVRPAAMIEEELAERLKGARRLAVVGIGDELHRADRFGILVVLTTVKMAMGRVRIDQLNDFGWKYLASLAMVQVLVVLLMNGWWSP